MASVIAGEEQRIVHATWSRSGKNLILTVARYEHWSKYQCGGREWAAMRRRETCTRASVSVCSCRRLLDAFM
jgi:hypothetical protein